VKGRAGKEERRGGKKGMGEKKREGEGKERRKKGKGGERMRERVDPPKNLVK